MSRALGRSTFDALATEGRRARSGPLRMTHLPSPHPGPATPVLAFAIGRSFGPAVARNRMRRRLRAAFAQCIGADAGGVFLITAQPRALRAEFGELRHAIRDCLRRLAVPVAQLSSTDES